MSPSTIPKGLTEEEVRLAAKAKPPRPMAGARAEEKRRRRRSSVKDEVRRRDHGLCVCCFSDEQIEVHHIDPLCFGGEDTAENCVCLCRDCHYHAPNDPAEFLSYQRQGGMLAWRFPLALKQMRAGLSDDLMRDVANKAIAEIEDALLSGNADEIRRQAQGWLKTHWSRQVDVHQDGWRKAAKKAEMICGWAAQVNPALPYPPAIAPSWPQMEKSPEAASRYLQGWIDAENAAAEAAKEWKSTDSAKEVQRLYAYGRKLAEDIYDRALRFKPA